MKRTKITNIANSLHQSIIWLILSTVSFATFFSMGYTSNYTTLPEIVNFHLLGFTGSCMILGIGFILNQITSTINYNVSIGTMVILGIHWMFIGVFNFAIKKYLHIDNITYSTFIAFIISLLRDIPKIIKFKATNSLRVSCLFCIFKHSPQKTV